MWEKYYKLAAAAAAAVAAAAAAAASRFSHVRLCVTPQTAAHQAPPSLGFSKEEHWSGITGLLEYNTI